MGNMLNYFVHSSTRCINACSACSGAYSSLLFSNIAKKSTLLFFFSSFNAKVAE